MRQVSLVERGSGEPATEHRSVQKMGSIQFLCSRIRIWLFERRKISLAIRAFLRIGELSRIQVLTQKQPVTCGRSGSISAFHRNGLTDGLAHIRGPMWPARQCPVP